MRTALFKLMAQRVILTFRGRKKCENKVKNVVKLSKNSKSAREMKTRVKVKFEATLTVFFQ